MIVAIALVGVFISGFVFGAVFGYRRLEDWFDPWLPAAVSVRLDGEWTWDDDIVVTGDVPPESTTETLR